jgi:hypothetical protein
MGGVGNNLWEASFVSSQGMSPNVSTLNTFLVATSVSYPLGENGEDVPLFLGWIGGPGERLHQVTLAPPATGIVVDNIQGYAPGNRVPVLVNPLPGALPLFATGLGALGLLGWWRKRKQVAA